MNYSQQAQPSIVIDAIDRFDDEINDVGGLVRAATFYAGQVSDQDTRKILHTLLCDAQDAIVRLEKERDAFEPKLVSICRGA